jgi:hypothetical protein
MQHMHFPGRITVCEALAGAVRIVVLACSEGVFYGGACWDGLSAGCLPWQRINRCVITRDVDCC